MAQLTEPPVGNAAVGFVPLEPLRIAPGQLHVSGDRGEAHATSRAWRRRHDSWGGLVAQRLHANTTVCG